jgi:L-aminoadipate-semialdehyde dehydrogenase
MPLYHFVTADLPSNTKAPELDDVHAAASLKADAAWSGVDVSKGAGVTEELVGLYVSYLVSIGFLPAPSVSDSASASGSAVRPLPAAKITDDQRNALAGVGGRGGTS